MEVITKLRKGRSFLIGLSIAVIFLFSSTFGVSAQTPLPGDADRDGDVDFVDITIISDSFGTDNEIADFNNNGIVDLFDYNSGVRNFGVKPASPTASPSPKPTVSSSPTPKPTVSSSPTAQPTVAPTTPPVSNGSGIWISQAEIMSLPMSGSAWENLKRTADGDLGTADISDQNNRTGVKALAAALVYARTGNQTYRQKVVDKLMEAINTDNNPDPNCDATPKIARSMSLGRNLASYIIASDVINLRNGTDNGKGTQWYNYVNSVRFKKNCPNAGSTRETLSETHDSAGSNGNAVAGMSRIAAAMYVGDTAEVARAWDTYRRYAGVCSGFCGFHINDNGKSWSSNLSVLAPVNPQGSTKNGHSVDGAIIADIGRGGAFTWPPGYTSYPWEGLQGFIGQAQLLYRAGYPSWAQANNAPLRATEYMYYLVRETGNNAWSEQATSDGKKSWVVWLVNHHYNSNFSAGAATSGYIGWTDWTHQ